VRLKPDEAARVRALVSQGMTFPEAYQKVLAESYPAAWEGSTSTRGKYFAPGQRLSLLDEEQAPVEGEMFAPGRPFDIVPEGEMFAPGPVTRPVTPMELADQDQPDDVPVTPPDLTGVTPPESRARTLLRSAGTPFAGAEGKMRLLEILGGLGQSLLGSRAVRAAEKRTAAGQARANLTNALSRRARSQAVPSQPREGLGMSLMGALATAGGMGREAIAQGKVEEQQQWQRGLAERGEALEERKVGVGEEQFGEEMEFKGRELESREHTARREAQDREAERGMRGRLGDAQIGLGRERNEIARRAAEARAAGKMPVWQQQKLHESEVQEMIVGELEGLLGDVERRSSPGAEGVAAVPGLRRLFPGAKTYVDFKRAIGLTLAATFNRGRPSDRDAEAMILALPDASEPLETQQRKIAALARISRMSKSVVQQGLSFALPVEAYLRPDGTLDFAQMARTVVPMAPSEADVEAGEDADLGPDVEDVDFGEE